MTKTKHAEVTQEHRDFRRTLHDRFNIEFFEDAEIAEFDQFLADYSAEVERKARLDEVYRCHRLCKDYRKSEYGPYGTEFVTSEHVESIADELEERIAELGGTK